MSGMKVDLRGLELFKRQLKKQTSLEALIPDITLAVLKFQTRFETRFAEVYKTKGTLESVRVGRTVEPKRLGASILRYGLQYRYKPAKLTDYSYIVMPSRALSVARVWDGKKLRKVRGTWSKQVIVKIGGDRGKAHVNKYSKQKTFLTPAGFMIARAGKATWIQEPSAANPEGVRAKTIPSPGPALSSLAGGLINHDNQVQGYLDAFETELVKAFTDFYIR